MQNNKYLKRILPTFFAICLIMSNFGVLIAHGTGAYKRSEINDSLSEYLNETIDMKNVVDIKEDSKTNEVNLELKNGSNTVYSFSEPVWYTDNSGQMKFKDVNIQKQRNTVDKKNGYDYCNGDNDYRINFSKSHKKGISVEFDDVSYKIIPQTKKNNSKNIESSVNKEKRDDFETDIFNYNNFYGNGTNLNFIPQLNGVKEEIVLDKYTGQNKFEFIIKTKDCYIELNNEVVEFKTKDENDPKKEKVLQTIALPFAYDSKSNGVNKDDKHFTEDCKYSIKSVSKNKYKLTLTVSKEWLNSKETVYPVTIDPVTTNLENSQDLPILSTSVIPSYLLKNSVGHKRLVGTYRSLVKFDLPEDVKNDGCIINNAYYWTKELTGKSSDLNVGAHLIEESWKNLTTVWATQPDFEQSPIDTNLINKDKNDDGGEDNTWFKFNITSAVNSWNNGTENNGFILKSTDENKKDYRQFAQKEYFKSNCRPYTVINYTLDKTSPSFVDVTGNTSDSKWTKQPVTLTINGASDKESGLNDLPYSFSTKEKVYNWQASNISPTYTTPQTVYVYIRDVAGNIKECGKQEIKVDTQAPTIDNVSGNHSDWSNKDVTLKINNASDKESGLHETPYSFSSSKDNYNWQDTNTKKYNKNQKVYVYVRDKIGNISLADTITIDKIDSGKPVITSIKKNDGENNETIITVDANDVESGLKGYSFDGGESWQQENSKSFEKLDGVKIKIKDKAGNIGSYIPPAPTELKCNNVSDTTAAMSWVQPKDTIDIVEFKIYNGDKCVGTTDKTTFKVENLENNTEYKFAVKSVNEFGDVSDASEKIKIKTGLNKPSNVTGTAGLSNIKVTWDEVYGADSYDLLINDDLHKDISTNSFNCTDLEQGTTYTIKVRAKTKNTTSLYSEPITVATDVIQELEGNITEDTTWNKNKSPYIIKGDLTIDENVTLTVEPGTIIKVKSGKKIIVNGNLICHGNLLNRIVFTSFTDKDYGGDGQKEYWGGIYAKNENSKIDINFSTIKYAGDKGGYCSIGCSMGELNVNFSTIKYGGSILAIDVGSKNSKLTHNIIKDYEYGIACSSYNGAHIIANDNIIEVSYRAFDVSVYKDSYFTANNNTVKCNGTGFYVHENEDENIDCIDTISMKGNSVCDLTKDADATSISIGDKNYKKATEDLLKNNDFSVIRMTNIYVNEKVVMPRAEYIFHDIHVAEQGDLNIEAGSNFVSYKGSEIEVKGNINAQGTTTMPITIKCRITIKENAKAVFNNVRILDVKKDEYNSLKREVIVSEGELEIYNSLIRNKIPNDEEMIAIDLRYYNENEYKNINIINNEIYGMRTGILVGISSNVDLHINYNKINETLQPVFINDFHDNYNDGGKTRFYLPRSRLRYETDFELNNYRSQIKFELMNNNLVTNGSSIVIRDDIFNFNRLNGLSTNKLSKIEIDGPVYIQDNYNFPTCNYCFRRAAICIGKNVTVSFGKGSKFFISEGVIFNEGNLNIIGTKENNIVFTRAAFDGDPLYWGTIMNKGKLTTRYAKFLYAGHDDGIEGCCSYHSCIISSGKVDIQKSKFEKCKSAIELTKDSSPDSIIKYNAFVDNRIFAVVSSTKKKIMLSKNYFGTNGVSYHEDLDDSFEFIIGLTKDNSEDLIGNLDVDELIGDEYLLARTFGMEGTYGPSGTFSRNETDLSMSNNNCDFKIGRTYNSRNIDRKLISRGWTFSFDAKISDYNPTAIGAGGDIVSFVDKKIKCVNLPDGSLCLFEKNNDGTFTAKDSRNSLVKTKSEYIMTKNDQTKYHFNLDGLCTNIEDKLGNKIFINYYSDGRPKSIVDSTNRKYEINYGSNSKISSIKDVTNNKTVIYNYTNGNLSEVIDPMGYSTYYTYDSENYLSGVYNNNHNIIKQVNYIHEENGNDGKVNYEIDNFGNKNTYTYDNKKKNLTITDSKGNKTVQYYDSKLAITKVVDKGKRTSQTIYPTDNKFYEPKETIDRNGNKTVYERDARGNVTKIINPDNSSKTMTYDNKNNLTSQKDENGNNVSMSYDANCNLTKKVENVNGKEAITKYTYYGKGNGININGLLKTETNPNGDVTSYTYDSYGNLTSKTLDNKTTNYKYSPEGLLLKETSPKGNAINYKYDNNGRQIKKILDENKVYRTVYDSDGNVVKTVLPNQYKSSFEGDNYSYSANHGTRFKYYSTGKVKEKKDALENITSYTYDIYGNVLTETLPNGSIYKYEYDVMNRPIKKYFREDSNSSQKLFETYSYSILKNHNTQTVKNTYINQTNFDTTTSVSDYAGRELSCKDADGLSTYTSYNPNGTVKNSTDKNGQVTYYQYNGLNKVTGQWVPFSLNLYIYTGYEYDNAGRVTKEKVGVDPVANKVVPSNCLIKSYTYNADGTVDTETKANGGKIKYSYDKDGNVTTKQEYLSKNKSNLTKYEYNYLGKVTKEKLIVRKGDISGNNYSDNDMTELVTSNTYDSNGNLKSTTNSKGTKTNYTYDNENKLLSAYQLKIKNGITYIKNSKTYNNIGKVATETDALGNTVQYEYDKRGNLIKEINPLGDTKAYYYDLQNRLISAVSNNDYKKGAQLSEMNRTEYTYDSMGRAITQTQVYYDTATKEWKSFVEKANKYDANGNVIKELDALGYEAGPGSTVQEKINNGYGIEKSYNYANQLISEISPQDKQDGLTFTNKYSYDALDRKISEESSDGSVLVNNYDAIGNITLVSLKDTKDSQSKVLKRYTYDYLGNKLTETDANGNTTTNAYNALGELKSTSFAGDSSISALTTYYQYDKVGNLTDKWDTTGKKIKCSYDRQNNLLSKSVGNIDGNQSITTTYSYDKNGNVLSTTDGNGVKTKFTYDSLGQKLSDTRSEKKTSYTYDKNGNVITTTDWLGNVNTNHYDALNRLVKKTDPFGNTVELNNYDNNHRQVTSMDALDNLTVFTYDKDGQLVMTTDPAGNENINTYDNVGNVIGKTDGNGNETKYSYDKQHRLLSVTAPNQEVTSYTYDNNGNMLTQTDASGKTTTYEYNVANKVTKIIDPNGRTEENGTYKYVPGKVQYFTYTPDCQVKTNTMRNGTVLAFNYDIYGRMAKKSATNGKRTQTVDYTYDNNNNLLTISDASGTTTRTYDDFGRVLTKSVPNIGTIDYEYDITDKMETGEISEKLMYPGGSAVTKVYDKVGRLSKVTADDDTTQYNYYDNGNVSNVVYGDGSKEEYEYTRNGLLSTLVNKKADDSIIDSYTYQYDKANNITSKTDNTGTTSYTYDSLNRLLTETYPSEKTIAYTYDGSGNRLTQTEIENSVESVTTYTYDDQNKLITTDKKENGVAVDKIDYTYDDNGNMLEKRVTSYENGQAQEQVLKLSNTFDCFNQLTMSVTDDGKTICNTYNGEGLRIQKAVDGVATNYLYEGQKVVGEYDGKYKLKAQNIQGLNLLMRKQDDNTYYYMYNGHADVVGLLNAKTGNLDASYYYDSFGNILNKTGNVNNSFLYAGYQYDEETGLYYLNTRMYDSETARFVQEDTYRGNATDPLSLNLYAYCANNPLIYTDPTGHSWLSNKWNNAKKRYKKFKSKAKKKYKKFKSKAKKKYKNFKSKAKKKYKRAKKVVKKTYKKSKTRIKNKVNSAKKFYKKHKKSIKKIGVGAAVIGVCALATVLTGGAAAGVAGTIAAGALKGAIGGAVMGSLTGSAIGAVSHKLKTGSWEGAGGAAFDGAADGFMSGSIFGAFSGGAKGALDVYKGAKAASQVASQATKTMGYTDDAGKIATNADDTVTLYHSAKPSAVDPITKSGFRTDLPSKTLSFNNNRFGRGVYLADSPKTALAERSSGTVLKVEAKLGKNLNIVNRGVIGGESDYSMTHAIARGARKHGYDSISFLSNAAQQQGFSGVNTVVMNAKNVIVKGVIY